jgi:uncharacterized protein involved in outer membrane biogenesis
MAKTRGCLSKLLLLVVIIGVAVAATPLLPLSPLKSQVEAKLSDTLGRRVTIDSLRLNLIGGPYLAITGMTAAEDEQFGDGVFLKANEVRAGLDVIHYLRARQIVINSITLKSPQLDLVKNHNGVWNWATLGQKRSPQSTASLLIWEALSPLSILSLAFEGNVSATTLRKLRIENASVRLVDRTESQPTGVLYNNIGLNASLAPYADERDRVGSQAKGDLIVQSEENGEADRFKATLPFDLKIVGSDVSTVSVSGSIGPGPIETKNVSIVTFAINGQVNSYRDAPLTGNGKLSAMDLVIKTVNLSERVASALKLDQIGDMSPGTSVASLEADFNISRGTVNTSGLNIQQLDGLGDATAPNGSFKIDSALTLNYAATVILSPEATSRVKSMSSTLELLVTILETNNRISVPINIIGDVRNPEVQVDVGRIF